MTPKPHTCEYCNATIDWDDPDTFVYEINHLDPVTANRNWIMLAFCGRPCFRQWQREGYDNPVVTLRKPQHWRIAHYTADLPEHLL